MINSKTKRIIFQRQHAPILKGLNALAEERGWVVNALAEERGWVVEVLPLVAGQRSVREKEWIESPEDVWNKHRRWQKNYL